MKMKKVGIEGIPLFGDSTGVGQYTKRLISAASQAESHIFFEVVRQWWFFKKFAPPLPANAHLSYRIVRWMPPIFYYQMFKRIGWAPPYDLVTLRKYSAFLFFNFVSFPVTKRTKSILVIYDLSYALHAQYSSPKNKAYLEKFVPPSITAAAHIITISENSKKEIMDHYKVSDKKISIVSPAVDHKLFRPQPEGTIIPTKKKYGINKPYLLSVCTLEPRKNLIGVLEAFELLPEEIKKAYCLVLVGGKGWLDGEIEQKYEKLSQTYSIIKTGYIPDEELPAIYSGATLFIYPSFYEGFGMPPLEAMACGTPVITSNNSSLPEVVGNAAIMIKAEDTKNLALQMQNVLENKEVAKDMREKGLKQSEQFTWSKSADKLIEVINEVAG